MAWVDKLPKELRSHFDFLTWNKEGNVYIKQIKEGTHDWTRFEQFWAQFSPNDMEIDKVYAIVNPILAASFVNHREILRDRIKDSPHLFWRKDWLFKEDPNNLRAYTHENILRLGSKHPWNVEGDLVPIIPCLHGTDYTIAQSIASKGFCALASIDAGYFGKGIYFTTWANYCVPYIVNRSEPCILVSLAVLGNALPVIERPEDPEGYLGKPIASGYQSHFVITGDDGYPTVRKPGQHEYNEIVLSQEAQVLAIYLVKFATSTEARKAMKVTVAPREVPRSSPNLNESSSTSSHVPYHVLSNMFSMQKEGFEHL